VFGIVSARYDGGVKPILVVAARRPLEPQALADLGMPVVTVQTQAAALAAIDEQDPAAILVDEWGMLKPLRARRQSTPIIIRSADVPGAALARLVKSYVRD
jgi:hypothetical protein